MSLDRRYNEAPSFNHRLNAENKWSFLSKYGECSVEMGQLEGGMPGIYIHHLPLYALHNLDSSNFLLDTGKIFATKFIQDVIAFDIVVSPLKPEISYFPFPSIIMHQSLAFALALAYASTGLAVPAVLPAPGKRSTNPCPEIEPAEGSEANVVRDTLHSTRYCFAAIKNC